MPYYAGGAMGTRGACGHDEGWAEPYRGQVDRVLDVAGALAATLAVLHDGPRRIVHRDVTVGNVFFAEPGGPPVLGDFGLATVEGGPERPVPNGDAAPGCWSNPWVWRPPELDAGNGYTMGAEGDIFMLGGLVFQAITGGRFLPPARDWGAACVHERTAFTLRRDTADPRATAVEALLERMLTRDPARRLPAREVVRVCRAIRSLPPGAGPAHVAPRPTAP